MNITITRLAQQRVQDVEAAIAFARSIFGPTIRFQPTRARKGNQTKKFGRPTKKGKCR